MQSLPTTVIKWIGLEMLSLDLKQMTTFSKIIPWVEAMLASLLVRTLLIIPGAMSSINSVRWLCTFQCYLYLCISLSAPTYFHLYADLKELRFLTLGSTSGVTRTYLQPSDDGASTTVTIPGGFEFGNTTQTSVYVRFCVKISLFACNIHLAWPTNNQN